MASRANARRPHGLLALALAGAVGGSVAGCRDDSDRSAAAELAKLEQAKRDFCTGTGFYLKALAAGRSTKADVLGAHLMIVRARDFCTGVANPDVIGDAILKFNEQQLREAVDRVADELLATSSPQP